MPQVQCFSPIESPSATVLILGSMPGRESLRAGQYYAHPRNAFWYIMGELVGASPSLPYDMRIAQLKSARIALWDVLASCRRDSSMDADIAPESIRPNDFLAFFNRHPHITHVFFNGAVAEQYFRRHVLPDLSSDSMKYQRLPSTSPANAAILLKDKLAAWSIILLDRDQTITG